MPWYRDTRGKYIIQGDIKPLLGRDCEEEMIMRLLRDKDTWRNRKIIDRW